MKSAMLDHCKYYSLLQFIFLFESVKLQDYDVGGLCPVRLYVALFNLCYLVSTCFHVFTNKKNEQRFGVEGKIYRKHISAIYALAYS